jgi:hypothetical protein
MAARSICANQLPVSSCQFPVNQPVIPASTELETGNWKLPTALSSMARRTAGELLDASDLVFLHQSLAEIGVA